MLDGPQSDSSAEVTQRQAERVKVKGFSLSVTHPHNTTSINVTGIDNDRNAGSTTSFLLTPSQGG